jgi:hypothetical protein
MDLLFPSSSLAQLHLRKRELLSWIGALQGNEATLPLRQELIARLQPVCAAIAQREHTLDPSTLPAALFP